MRGDAKSSRKIKNMTEREDIRVCYGTIVGTSIFSGV